ncbi:putative FAD dependent oxidoreductase-1 [Coleophoma cylindrospora]|uniref:Putative FAD dependent oxidoreductase-1 n=1 Tax=Coleophoma cylindrospora TaxID=1849047 RepID=A0A3D8R730_9HELO|nr:putative FAD dependent oxidoreductase-1 [Coleophoma cylindrospora]
MGDIPVFPQLHRPEEARLNIIIVGAGLGGLGAAISLLLAGHNVKIYESATRIDEIGAGIQVLPNASKILTHWGLHEKLSAHSCSPTQCNLINWHGEPLTSMSFTDASQAYGSPFWDFHRSDLHRVLYERVLELGGTVEVKSRVVDCIVDATAGSATVELASGAKASADLVIGADGIRSKMREVLVGHPVPPTPTGDLAYRLLLDTKALMGDADLRAFVEQEQVTYWMGPGIHVVVYLIRNGGLLNMVLLVPDDMPEGATTMEGDIEEMKALFKGWDPRIGKLLSLCKEVQKWKLCIQHELAQWTHPQGHFTLLGDAVHATLPYLASGAGMSLEDGCILGLCLSSPRLPASRKPSGAELNYALQKYEECRKPRTSRIVARGSHQGYLYHLDDGPEQVLRDQELKRKPTREGEALVWRDPGVAPWLLGFDVFKDVSTRASLRCAS